MSGIIRPAVPDDAEWIAAIYREEVLHGTATFEVDPPDVAEMAARIAATQGAEYPFLVAEDGGTIAGYAYAVQFRGRAAFRTTVEDSVYVAPRNQKRGTGKALLDALIKECGARGFRQMIAVIGDSQTQLASIALHTSAGFTYAGRLDGVGYKRDRWLDCVLMQRRLQ